MKAASAFQEEEILGSCKGTVHSVTQLASSRDWRMYVSVRLIARAQPLAMYSHDLQTCPRSFVSNGYKEQEDYSQICIDHQSWSDFFVSFRPIGF